MEDFSPEEAQEILDTTLINADLQDVHSVFKDMGQEMYWKTIIEAAFPPIVGLIEEIFYSKINKDSQEIFATKALWASAEASGIIDEDEPRTVLCQQLLVLKMVKKLLGGLKTKVNRLIQDIPLITSDEEETLLDIVDIANRNRIMQTPKPEKLAEVTALYNRRAVSLESEGDCRQNSRHIRLVIRYKTDNNTHYREEFCKDCRQIVRTTTLESPGCQCKSAEWVEGQEGKTARCPDCHKIVDDPSRYLWKKAGLEPVGDDPAQDEVITLCSVY